MTSVPRQSDVERSAVISTCGTYRYALERRWSPRPAVLFVMLNPSTADAERDDPTIRRCMGFARAWGYGALLVGNLFAFRATKPRELRDAADPVGDAGDAWLSRLFARSAMVIAAWGAHPMAGSRAEQVRDLLCPNTIYALRVTKAGAPGHPLYVPADTEPVPYWQEGGR